MEKDIDAKLEALKNIQGEVTIKMGEKVITKPLKEVAIKLSTVLLAAVGISSLLGSVLLGGSLVGLIGHFVLTMVAIGAAVYFGKDFILSKLLGVSESKEKPAKKAKDKKADEAPADEAIAEEDAEIEDEVEEEEEAEKENA